MTTSTQASIDEILENFSFLDDWDDRYRYLIELGKTLEPLSGPEHNADNKVNGCVSQVWIVCNIESGENPTIHFTGDSDAHIVRGLVAIALALFSGRRADEIFATDALSVFAEIGLDEHLTPQRSNGLRSMIDRIKLYAANAG